MTVLDEILGILSTLPREKQQAVLAFAKSPSVQQVKKPLRSPEGLWADQGIDITAEEIKAMRKDGWANFPREF
jgi:hypothetical protein